MLAAQQNRETLESDQAASKNAGALCKKVRRYVQPYERRRDLPEDVDGLRRLVRDHLIEPRQAEREVIRRDHGGLETDRGPREPALDHAGEFA